MANIITDAQDKCNALMQEAVRLYGAYGSVLEEIRKLESGEATGTSKTINISIANVDVSAQDMFDAGGQEFFMKMLVATNRRLALELETVWTEINRTSQAVADYISSAIAADAGAQKDTAPQTPQIPRRANPVTTPVTISGVPS